MRGLIKKMRKIKIIKIITDAGYAFVCEYITNHVIAHIPLSKFRQMYYRYVLGHKIASSAYIYLGQYIYVSKKKISIGENTCINRYCVLDGRGGLHIGDNVNISAEAAIYTGGHIINSSDFDYYDKSVVIGDRVWIGTRAMIMPGVKVGEGAMVLPAAVVTKDVMPYEIVGGVPAKVVGSRSRELNYTLERRGFFR